MHLSFRHIACLITCVFALVACSSENKDGNAPSQPTQTVKGQAVKGVISNGVVSAYTVDSGDQSLELIFETETDLSGNFILQVAQKDFNQPILLQITSNAQNTSMKCDQALGCTDKTNGNWYEFGELVPLESDFQLLGLAQQYNDRNEYSANISSLSHLIVSTALNLPDGLTFANIEQANNWVADSLGLQTDPLTTPLIDITDNINVEQSDTSSVIMSLLGASLFELAQTQSWYNASITINDIAPSNIFKNSAAIAQHLSVTLDNDKQAQVDTLLAKASSTSAGDGFRILSSPESRSTTLGDSFYFRAHASSDASLKYQWLHNGIEIPGASSAIYGKASAKASDAGSYQVRVSSAGQTLFSSLATLQVNTTNVALDFSQQPRGATLVSGQSLTLNASTNLNDNVEIRWQRNGSLLSTQHGSTLQIFDVANSDSGAYRAIASRNGQIIYSNFAHVQVTDALSGIQITEHPQSLALLNGQQANLQVEASGGGFLRYQWYMNGTKLNDATRSYMTLSNVSAADEGSYFVEVSNSSGKIASSQAEIQVISKNAALELLEHPRSAQVYLGDSHTLGVKTSAQTTHTYQWFRDGNPILGAQSEYFTISDAKTADSGAYHVIATSALGSLSSNTAKITVREHPSLALSWAMPSERENGEPLNPSEIYGYRLEYGYKASSINNGVTVVGASNTQFTLANLESGSVYLHIATIDSDGITGRFSAPIEVYLP